jgi:hypothetical protein
MEPQKSLDDAIPSASMVFLNSLIKQSINSTMRTAKIKNVYSGAN